MTSTDRQHRNVIKFFSFKRIIWPILLGGLVAFYMIYQDFSKPVYLEKAPGQGEYIWHDYNENGVKEADEMILPKEGELANISIETQKSLLKHIVQNWTWGTSICLFFAMVMGLMRDFMYILRIRLLTDNQLSWKQSFQIIMLWEFGSAITPSVVGGSALAFFTVSLEGIPAGRATAIVLSTALLDELFYIIVTPIVLLIVGFDIAFMTDFQFAILGMHIGVEAIFALGYGFMCFLTLFILFSIFFQPKKAQQFLAFLGRCRPFRKWSQSLNKMGDDLVTTSAEFKEKSFWFWIKAYGYTVISWSARFFVVNFLILAFTPVGDHFSVWARQLVMWIVLCISPTPGSTGIAEFAFPLFLGDYLPGGMEALLAVLWRMYTYYPYIILGLLVLPWWTKRIIRLQVSRRVEKRRRQEESR